MDYLLVTNAIQNSIKDDNPLIFQKYLNMNCNVICQKYCFGLRDNYPFDNFQVIVPEIKLNILIYLSKSFIIPEKIILHELQRLLYLNDYESICKLGELINERKTLFKCLKISIPFKIEGVIGYFYRRLNYKLSVNNMIEILTDCDEVNSFHVYFCKRMKITKLVQIRDGLFDFHNAYEFVDNLIDKYL